MCRITCLVGNAIYSKFPLQDIVCETCEAKFPAHLRSSTVAMGVTTSAASVVQMNEPRAREQ